MDTVKQIDTLIFYVNGHKVCVDNPDPAVTLLQFLRNNLALRGVKSACQEGGCGSCTVMLSKYCRVNNKISHYSVVACLTSICALHGLAVTTIEALGNTKTKLHPLQERLAKSHGTQCGFCSPGMVMSMYALLRNDPQPSRQDIEQALEGNLCRCTGYRSILAGFHSFSKESPCAMGDDCCRNKENYGDLHKANVSGLDSAKQYLPYDPSQDPIFPPELQLSDVHDMQSLTFRGEQVTWFRPVTVPEALAVKHAFPDAQFIGGGTEVDGLSKKLKSCNNVKVIVTGSIIDLKYTKKSDTSITFGSAVTLTTLMRELASCINNIPDTRSQYLRALEGLLKVYASTQIRNVATVGGAVTQAGDLMPLLKVSEANIVYAENSDGNVSSLIQGLEIPFSEENVYCRIYKVADRRQFGTSYVTGAFKVKLGAATTTVEDFSAYFTSFNLPSIRAASSASVIIGKHWNDSLVDDMRRHLQEEVIKNWSANHDVRLEYKASLAASLFLKFYLSVTAERSMHMEGNEGTTHRSIQNHSLFREPSCGTQVFEEVAASQSESDTVGRPVVHLSSLHHVTGEAVYVDDMPQYNNELHMAFVTSKYAHAQILDVDTREAVAMPGVKAILTHKDVPGSNKMGAIYPDEEIFATEKVNFQGQVIAGVVADTYEKAARAADAVKVQYIELKPIVTIEEAIVANSFMEPVSTKTLTSGDIKAGFAESDCTIEGAVMCGPQEHMCMETAATICIPSGENGEMTVHTNTQYPDLMQDKICEALGTTSNKIVLKVKRAGGAFGGKQRRNMLSLVPAAVAAYKLNKPVRCVLDREDETLIKGTRHAVLAKYKVAFTEAGLLVALDVNIYFNCGYSNDISVMLMNATLSRHESGYRIPNLRLTGHLCRTNIHSATAMRGFGAPQGAFIMENVLCHVASELRIQKEKISFLNLYRVGDVTPHDVTLDECTVRRCWEECEQNGDYQTRLRDVQTFNSMHRWMKKGISITPAQFPICSGLTVLSQAGALVHIYKDGSVLVSHGGVEMGQGLHTKIIQITNCMLGVPVDKIHITDTSTDNVANSPVTGGSFGTDVFGTAVMNACRILKERLDPYKEADPRACWEKWVLAAFHDQVSLSATGFNKVECGGDKGASSWYYTYGAACTEVMVDCLTGEHLVLRTDIVMDVGRSLNPAIDIGQIEGAFLQGYGFLTMEEMRYSDKGELLTRGPNSYKIPGVQDVPVKMNVALLKGSTNKYPRAVYSSKGIGEPSFTLATSVVCAIREAIVAARLEVGNNGHFRLDAPVTPEKIRLLC